MDNVAVMDDVVRRAHCIDGALVFGGYVRDRVMRQEGSPRDVDIFFPAAKDAETFLRMCACTYVVRCSEPREIYTWAKDNITHTVATVSPSFMSGAFTPFNIDISVGEQCLCRDFTCNMLCMSRSGISLAGGDSYLRFQPSPLSTVLEHVRAGVFAIACVPGSLLRRQAVVLSERLCRRAGTMLARGWRMLPDGTNFYVATAKAISEMSQPDAILFGQEVHMPEACSVCQEAMQPASVVVVSRCAHVFHHECIMPWLSQGRTICGCPVCRDTRFILSSEPRDCELSGTSDEGSDQEGDESEGESDGESDDEDYEDDDDEFDEEDVPMAVRREEFTLRLAV